MNRLNRLNRLIILEKYPTTTTRQINAAIKYQDKFNLTLENLKCLNPDCYNMREWNKSSTNFKYCCSKECTIFMKKEIDKIGAQHNMETYEKRTGYKKPGQNPEVKQKMKETCLNRYGYENPFQNPEVKQKMKESYLKKTGYLHPSLNPEVQQKSKQTYFKRTGYINSSLNPTVILKRKNTYSKKTGFNSYAQTNITKFEHWNDRQFWLDNFITKNNKFELHNCIKYFNCKQPAAHNQIKKLGIEYTKLSCISLKEQALYPLLDDINITFETNNRTILKGQELDIYLPDLKLAIEYNGSYWHSYHPEVGKNTSPKQMDLEYMKYRHQQKSLACYSAGIRLLHIYEHQTKNEVLNNLESFLLYDPEMDINTEWDLDTGCYPLGLEYQILEPISIDILKDRVIWNAGKIVTS